MNYDLDLVSTPIQRTTLSVRVKNALLRAGINTISDLVFHLESGTLENVNGLGEKSKNDLSAFVAKLSMNPGSVLISKGSGLGSDSYFAEYQGITPLREYGYLESIPIVDGKFSIRVRNALQRAGIISVGDLIRRILTGEINEVRNFGEKGKAEVRTYLKDQGILKIITSNEIANQSRTTEQDSLLETLRFQPASLWAPFLDNRDYSRILKGGFGNAEEVVAVALKNDDHASYFSVQTRKLIEDIYQQYSTKGSIKFMEFALEKHQAFLSNRLLKKIIHPEISIGIKKITSLLHREHKPYELPYLLQTIANANQYPDLSYEFMDILDLKERELQVILWRYGYEDRTLQDVGVALGVTRERVRQIERKAKRLVWDRVQNSPNTLLRSALKYANDLENDFSFNSWIDELKKKKVLGKIASEHPLLGLASGIDEILYTMIGVSSKEPIGETMVSQVLRSSLKNPGLSVGSIEILEKIPNKKRREILRRIAYTGGIRIEDCIKILRLSEEETHLFLDLKDFFYFGNGWYTFTDPSQFARSPFLTAGLKLFEACGSLSFAEFCRGLRSYSSRFYPALAPKELVWYMLELYGFEVSKNKVNYPSEFKSRINGSERLFLDLLVQLDGVASFYEIVSHFIESGYSLAGASIGLLSHSPLPVKIEKYPDRFSYYTLRGREISWDQLTQASERQIKVSADSTYEYRRDGSIRYLTTLNTWAVISGVMAVHSLPDLSGEWAVTANGSSCGKASMDESFMWGLSDVLASLEVTLGDRIEVQFNTWDRTAVFRKIANAD